MKLSEMTTQHLINSIYCLKRMLKKMPESGYYIGNSDYAEDAVEQENRLNEELAEEIKIKIKLAKAEAKRRHLRILEDKNDHKE